MDNLHRYRRELEKIEGRLRDEGANEHLTQVRDKLARVVTLLEASNPPKEPRAVPSSLNGVVVGSVVLVRMDSKWHHGEVAQVALPEFVAIVVPELGRTVKITDFGRIRCLKPTTAYSNPPLPMAETRSDSKGKGKRKPKPAGQHKETEYEKAAAERQQSWRDFKKLQK